VAVMTMILGIVVYSLIIANLTVLVESYGRKQAEAKVKTVPVKSEESDIT